MDRLFKILVITVVALPLLACNNETKKRASINTVREYRGTAAPPYSYNGQNLPNYGTPNYYNPGNTTYGQGRLWGSVYAGNLLSYEQFDYYLHDLVAAFMNPNDLGYVSGAFNDSTGVRFWGYVEPTTGGLNPYGTNNVSINNSRAELRMVIWDSYAGQVDSSGELITEVPIHIRGGASGTISGNRAVIRFTDKIGFIEFSGAFDSNYYYGTVWFDNTGGAANYMGEFAVPTCSFFKCQ